MIIVDNLEYLSSYYSCSSRRLHPHRSIYVSLLSYFSFFIIVVRIIVDTVLIDLTHAAYVITFPLVNSIDIALD